MARPSSQSAFDLIHPGAEVEVWCRSLGLWADGFIAVDLDHGGWRVRRRSDGAVLPVRFAHPDDVRRWRP